MATSKPILERWVSAAVLLGAAVFLMGATFVPLSPRPGERTIFGSLITSGSVLGPFSSKPSLYARGGLDRFEEWILAERAVSTSA